MIGVTRTRARRPRALAVGQWDAISAWTAEHQAEREAHRTGAPSAQV